MKEHHVKDKLSEYIDGMLSQEEASAVKEHLDRCPECMEEYQEMVKIIGHMNQMESLETPEFFVEKVHARIEEPLKLQRLVRGLFFPLKIKVPLELAGVAAAALLVIYIVGIRGKQHIYELAYSQRPQPLSVLKEQRMIEGAEAEETLGVKIDKAATPSKKAQTELEDEEEEVKKRDKRADVEENITPGKKDLAASAPQEKRIEKQSKVEEAVPRSKMVQKREEPSLEIADKEKGEAKKDTFATPTPREISLEDIVAGLGLKIIKSEYNEDTQVLESLIIEIPADKYQKLIQTLEERGDIYEPYPAIKERDQEIIQIRIILQQ